METGNHKTETDNSTEDKIAQQNTEDDAPTDRPGEKTPG